LISIYAEIQALPPPPRPPPPPPLPTQAPKPIITDPVNFNASNKNLNSLKSVFNGYDVTKIVTLDLSFNQIKSLEPNSFVNFTSLTTLYLNNNQINDIYYGWFLNLPFLSTLSLKNNRLTSLPTGIFYGLSSLTSL
jgi:Leucine-rich repeat (LRR) protein